MGTWGTAPWDDDAAADWFGELFEKVPLSKAVEETLRLDPESYAPEIRAAASLLILLGRRYVWPIDDLDRHLQMAISQLERVQMAVGDDEDIVESIDQEIVVLKSRLGESPPAATASQPAGWTDFWA